MAKTYEFPEELVNDILGFLGEQKYTLVAQLINRIGASIERGVSESVPSERPEVN